MQYRLQCGARLSSKTNAPVPITVTPSGTAAASRTAAYFSKTPFSIIKSDGREIDSNPCPPVTVGVGIGSDFEGCALLAKYALTRPLTDSHPDPNYAALEKTILDRINALGIGPQGFGGDTSAFAVKIEVGPTHIAGLPVAVNINCHVVRHASIVL